MQQFSDQQLEGVAAAYLESIRQPSGPSESALAEGNTDGWDAIHEVVAQDSGLALRVLSSVAVQAMKNELGLIGADLVDYAIGCWQSNPTFLDDMHEAARAHPHFRVALGKVFVDAEMTPKAASLVHWAKSSGGQGST